MKRILLIASALMLLCGALLAAEAKTVVAAGSYEADVRMTVEPSFAYRISSSDLGFQYGDAAQALELMLTERVLYAGDRVRVTAPTKLTLTDGETERTLDVSFLPADAESAPESETAVYDFDVSGALTLNVTPDWTDAKSGVYTGEARLTLAVDAQSGFDYEGTAASSVGITLPISATVERCTITVYVGPGGSVKLTEDGEALEADLEHPYEFELGRAETAALWIAPDEGYAVGEVSIDPDEGWIALEDDRLVFTEIQADSTVTLTFVKRIASIDLDAHLIEFTPGGVTEQKLSATIAPDAMRDAPVKWTSSDADVAAVDQTGLVYVPEDGSCGSTLIRCAAQSDESVYAECAVVVHSSEAMVLPSALRVIGEEAFADSGATEYILPAGVEKIEAHAFARSSVKLIKIMNKDIELDDKAFEYCEDVTLFCPRGSRVKDFADTHGLRCILYDD